MSAQYFCYHPAESQEKLLQSFRHVTGTT
jgi:hypothetical protein